MRNNLEYSDNLILAFAKEGAIIEGTRFYSDVSIAGTEFHDNIIKAEALDDMTTQVAAIVTQGYFRKLDSLPVLYRDSVLISNVTLVQFGSAYGRGNNHHFERIEFVRIGERDDFSTFRFDGTYWSTGHVVLDGIFGPGTAADDVYWAETASISTYDLAWTLSLDAPTGSTVTILDGEDATVFVGVVDENGRITVPLIQAAIRPVEWLPTDNPDQLRGVKLKDQHVVHSQTPHTITVTGGEGGEVVRIVEMTSPRHLVVTAEELAANAASASLMSIPSVDPAAAQADAIFSEPLSDSVLTTSDPESDAIPITIPVIPSPVTPSIVETEIDSTPPATVATPVAEAKPPRSAMGKKLMPFRSVAAPISQKWTGLFGNTPLRSTSDLDALWHTGPQAFWMPKILQILRRP